MAIKVGRWDCKACGHVGNYGPATRCEKCSAPRPKDVRFYLPANAEVVTDEKRLKEARAGADWRCGHCQAWNKAASNTCTSCGNPRSADSGDVTYATNRVRKSTVVQDTLIWIGMIIGVFGIPLSLIFLIGIEYQFEGTVVSGSWSYDYPIQAYGRFSGTAPTQEEINADAIILLWDGEPTDDSLSRAYGFETGQKNTVPEFRFPSRVQFAGQAFIRYFLQDDLGNGYFDDGGSDFSSSSSDNDFDDNSDYSSGNSDPISWGSDEPDQFEYTAIGWHTTDTLHSGMILSDSLIWPDSTRHPVPGPGKRFAPRVQIWQHLVVVSTDGRDTLKVKVEVPNSGNVYGIGEKVVLLGRYFEEYHLDPKE